MDGGPCGRSQSRHPSAEVRPVWFEPRTARERPTKAILKRTRVDVSSCCCWRWWRASGRAARSPEANARADSSATRAPSTGGTTRFRQEVPPGSFRSAIVYAVFAAALSTLAASPFGLDSPKIQSEEKEIIYIIIPLQRCSLIQFTHLLECYIQIGKEFNSSFIFGMNQNRAFEIENWNLLSRLPKWLKSWKVQNPLFFKQSNHFEWLNNSLFFLS